MMVLFAARMTVLAPFRWNVAEPAATPVGCTPPAPSAGATVAATASAVAAASKLRIADRRA